MITGAAGFGGFVLHPCFQKSYFALKRSKWHQICKVLEKKRAETWGGNLRKERLDTECSHQHMTPDTDH